MNIHVHTKCIYARLTALYENNSKHIHIEICTSNTYNKHTVVKISVVNPTHRMLVNQEGLLDLIHNLEVSFRFIL